MIHKLVRKSLIKEAISVPVLGASSRLPHTQPSHERRDEFPQIVGTFPHGKPSINAEALDIFTTPFLEIIPFFIGNLFHESTRNQRVPRKSDPIPVVPNRPKSSLPTTQGQNCSDHLRFQNESLITCFLSAFHKSKICESIKGRRTWEVVSVDRVKREVIVSFTAVRRVHSPI